MSEIPLGKPENSTFEAMSRDQLRDPFSVVSEVVGMLNARGGEVWVGLREEGHVSVAIEPIERIELAAEDLGRYLDDAIEPRPGGAVEVVAVEDPKSSGAVLVVRVAERLAAEPYCALRAGGRYFWVRDGDRLRPMTRLEVFAGVSGTVAEPYGPDLVVNQVLERRKKSRDDHGQGLWLALEPVISLDLSPESEELSELVTEPALTGVRPEGRTFLYPLPGGLRADRERLVLGNPRYQTLTIERQGGIELWVSLASLARGPLRVWPLALAEQVVSALRLARAVYQTLGQAPREAWLIADLALFGVRGLALAAQAVRLPSSPRRVIEIEDVLSPEPTRLAVSDLYDQPERCGYRLLRRLYETAGLHREDLPPEFDRRTGRLMLD